MNSLYNSLNRTQSSPSPQLKNLIKSFKNSSNQEQFLRKLIQNNPNVQNIYSLIQNSNKTPKELFYLLAEQKGIDPDSILNMFNQ